MSDLKIQQINSKSIRTVTPNRNMDASSQSQLYVALSWLFPVIALVLFAIARIMQVNSRNYKSEENIKPNVSHSEDNIQPPISHSENNIKPPVLHNEFRQSSGERDI